MSEILLKCPESCKKIKTEVGRSYFTQNETDDKLFRIDPKETILSLKPDCLTCLGYYSKDVLFCYMSSMCPCREHRGGRLVHELRRYLIWFYVDNLNNVKYLLSPSSITHLSIFSKYFDIFIYGLFKQLKIQIHHGNQCSTDNRPDNLSFLMQSNHLRDGKLHVKNHPGSRLDQIGVLINTSELLFTDYIKKNIKIDLHGKTIVSNNGHDQKIKKIYFDIVLEDSNQNNLKELLKINKIEDQKEFFKNYKKIINDYRNQFTILKNSPEFKDPVKVNNDQEAMDILYKIQEQCKPYAKKFLDEDMKIPKWLEEKNVT